MNRREEKAMMKAIAGLAPFWPHLLVPKTEGDEDAEVGGIAMYRDLAGALQLQVALNEAIKGMTS